MLNRKIIHSSHRKCRSETEIRSLFERHMEELVGQKRRMINEINEWANNLLQQIHENVVQQKALLEQEYKGQVNYLHVKCQEFLDTALIYEEQKNREEVRLLIEQCHSLKTQLGDLQYSERSILFIKIQKEKPSTLEHRDILARDRFKNRPTTINNDSTTENNNSPRLHATSDSTCENVIQSKSVI